MTAVLYNCLLLKSRTLTDHEKTNLDHVGVSYIPHEEYVLIGPKGGDFTSPMTIELTHYHHLDNLLALMACYVDPDVKSVSDYPVRHVQPRAHTRGNGDGN